MDPVTNPFAPGAGTQPPELVGRDDILEKTSITLERIKRGYNAKSYLLIGLRGVGKTVLLNKIEGIAIKTGYTVSLIEAQEKKSLPNILVPALRRILLQLSKQEQATDLVRKAFGALQGFAKSVKINIGEISIQIDSENGIADTGDIEIDLPDLLDVVGLLAKEKNKPVAIIIDELQYTSEQEFGALIMAMHKISQKKLPLILIGAGLPPLVGLAGKSKSYAERLFDYPKVGALEKSDAMLALKSPAKKENVIFNKNALSEIVKKTEGYPYFIQEWGYHTWNVAEDSPITIEDVEKASEMAKKSLDESFFRVRLDRLTPREKDYLFAMAKLGEGPHRSGDIAQKLGVEVRSVAPIRNSLIKKGMVYSPSYGDTGFTVPMFDDYLKRISPA